MTYVEKNASGVYDSPTFKSTGTNILQTDATSTISVFVRVDEAADWVKADNIKAAFTGTEGTVSVSGTPKLAAGTSSTIQTTDAGNHTHTVTVQ